MLSFGRRPRPTRRKLNQEAWMGVEGAFATRKCSIVDMSEGGAKIKVEDPLFIRPVFQLKFSPADRGKRCKLCWRKGPLIGVEFI